MSLRELSQVELTISKLRSLAEQLNLEADALEASIPRRKNPQKKNTNVMKCPRTGKTLKIKEETIRV